MKLFDKDVVTSVSELNKPRASGLAYSLTSVIPVMLSMLFLIVITACGLKVEQDNQPDWYLYCCFLLPQIGSLLIVAFFMKCKQTSIREICKPVKWRYFLIAVVLQFGLFSLAELNTWFLELLGKVGYAENEILVPNMDGFGFVGVLFTIAVLPSVFEELLCRELLLKGLKGFGTVFAVLVSGALFALYHQRPEQTVYQFCCGAAFALVAIKANSVFPTVLAHFLNNALVLFSEKFGWEIINLPFIICSAVCLVGSLAYLCFFEKGKESDNASLLENENVGKKREFFLFAVLGLFIFGLTWLSELAMGF